MTLVTYLFIIIFLIGLYFYAKGSTKYSEGLTNNGFNKSRCPNLLIQKGSRFYLYNSKLAQVPGVNPVEFDNLEDYTEFLDWQRSQGIRCPVLYLQQSYDTQGNEIYKVRPSVSEPQAGLPPSIASSSGNTIMENPSGLGTPDALAYPNPTLLVDATRNDPPYNKNSYPAFDQSSYYVGTTTPLDTMNIQQEQSPISPDPMDPNWGGASYTQNLVDKGYYAENNVAIYIP
uniref:Uncharacterized protein n=1 Tax=viral metagenome TaxID=1070528 RepID=A0A6C0ESQ5_9ZZZZ